jgi:hypothetical protein
MTVFHRRLIAAKMNSVHSSIAASQPRMRIARASQSQLEINLYLLLAWQLVTSCQFLSAIENYQISAKTNYSAAYSASVRAQASVIRLRPNGKIGHSVFLCSAERHWTMAVWRTFCLFIQVLELELQVTLD